MSQATAIQIDDKTKAKAEKALKRAGVSPQQAVQRLYRYIADKGVLPQELSTAAPRKNPAARYKLVPNAATRKAIRDVEAGIGVRTYKNARDLMRDLEGDE